MHDLNERVRDLLERKVEEVVDRGDISGSELECIYKAYKTIYYMTTTEAMEDYGDDYSRGYTHTPDWSRDMNSMRRGRGADGRYKSMHSVNDRIIANLERELNTNISDFERQRIMDEIHRLRDMKD